MIPSPRRGACLPACRMNRSASRAAGRTVCMYLLGSVGVVAFWGNSPERRDGKSSPPGGVRRVFNPGLCRLSMGIVSSHLDIPPEIRSPTSTPPPPPPSSPILIAATAGPHFASFRLPATLQTELNPQPWQDRTGQAGHPTAYVHLACCTSDLTAGGKQPRSLPPRRRRPGKKKLDLNCAHPRKGGSHMLGCGGRYL